MIGKTSRKMEKIDGNRRPVAYLRCETHIFTECKNSLFQEDTYT